MTILEKIKELEENAIAIVTKEEFLEAQICCGDTIYYNGIPVSCVTILPDDESNKWKLRLELANGTMVTGYVKTGEDDRFAAAVSKRVDHECARYRYSNTLFISEMDTINIMYSTSNNVNSGFYFLLDQNTTDDLTILLDGCEDSVDVNVITSTDNYFDCTLRNSKATITMKRDATNNEDWHITSATIPHNNVVTRGFIYSSKIAVLVLFTENWW